MKKLITLALITILSGCGATGASIYDSLATANDTKLDIAIGTLCDPLSEPPINRKYADQPAKIKAINELCMH